MLAPHHREWILHELLGSSSIAYAVRWIISINYVEMQATANCDYEVLGQITDHITSCPLYLIPK